MTVDYSGFFPYSEFKPYQREVLDFTGHVVSNSQIGLIEAYCGFGKTISTFAPALALGKKILLLTPTYSARNAAVAEVLRMNKVNGKELVVADLRGKAVMCARFQKDSFSHEACERSKNDQTCSYFRKTFSKPKELSKNAFSFNQELVERMLSKPEIFFNGKSTDSEPLLFEKVQKVAGKRMLCSYELVKNLVSEADVVILDYFWVFTGIFSILAKLIGTEDFVLLIDEADLLVDRIYNNYHTQLSLQALKILHSQAKHGLKAGILMETDILFLEEFIRYSEQYITNSRSELELSPNEIISFFETRFKETAKRQGLKGEISLAQITKNLETIIESLKGLAESEKATARPDLFLKQLEAIKDSGEFLAFIPSAKDKIVIKPFEINAITLTNGKTLKDTLLEFQSVILFSATIGDPDLFLKEFGLKRTEVNILRIKEMPHKKLLFVVDTELNTLYTSREQSFPAYLEKIRMLMKIDNSLLVSFCNQTELEKALAEIPELQDASKLSVLDPEKSYALNIRTRSARSTNKARHLRNCLIVGLPLPDYSDFYLQKRKDYLEKKYSKLEAGKIINGKAVDNAVQFIGRITRDLKSPRAIILADSRYYSDYFLKHYYFQSLPAYFKPFLRIAAYNSDLKQMLEEFWEKPA